MSDTTDNTPARRAEDGIRPPFPEGNAAHLTTGHRSVRVIRKVAREMADGLLADKPYLAQFPEEVTAWAEAEAQLLVIRSHVAKTGTMNADGEPRMNLLKVLQSWDNQARRGRNALGLNPASAAALAKQQAETVAAFSVVEFAQSNREARLAREAEFEVIDRPTLEGRVLAEVQSEGRAAQEAENERHAERVRLREAAQVVPGAVVIEKESSDG